jgi:hypothetical protein
MFLLCFRLKYAGSNSNDEAEHSHARAMAAAKARACQQSAAQLKREPSRADSSLVHESCCCLTSRETLNTA